MMCELPHTEYQIAQKHRYQETIFDFDPEPSEPYVLLNVDGVRNLIMQDMPSPKMPENSAAEDAVLPMDAAPRTQRILIFEDDSGYAEALGSLLRHAGYEPLVATHFTSALEALANPQPPDLLITDIVMPPGQVNGLAMARMARMKRRGIRVLYVTGYDLPGTDREAFGPVLRKPIADNVMLSHVQRSLCSE